MSKNYPVTLKWLVIFLISSFIVYFYSLSNSFVWDDKDQIFSTHTGDVLENITKFFFGFHYGNPTGVPITAYETYYKPLFYTTLAILYGFFGSEAFFYHLFQVLLHSVNAFLVLIFFRQFLRKNLSFILTLIFLIHPINSEAVLYISALQEPLFFFFGMIALIILNADRLSRKQLLMGGLLILLSMFTKETGTLFLIIIGLFHLIYRKSSWLKIITVEVLVLGIYLTTRLLMAKVFFVTLTYVPIVNLSFIERLYTVPAVFFYYIKTFFYPKDLIIAQHWFINSPSDSTFYLPLFLDSLLLLTVVSLGIYVWKFKKIFDVSYMFFSLWFFLGIGLHLQLIPLDMTVAERWFYFPIVGLLGMIGVFLNTLKFNSYKKVMIVLCILVLSLLSLRTLIRSFDWKNAITLYQHDIQHNDSSYDLESNLGTELFRAGRKEEAKQHFEKSITLAPKHWINSANLAGYYYDAKDFANAEKYYLISIANNPYFKFSYENYVKMLLTMEDNSNITKAKAFIEKSLKIFPRNSKLWLYLAIANYKLGLTKEALKAAKQSVNLAPNNDNQYIYSRLLQNLPVDIK